MIQSALDFVTVKVKQKWIRNFTDIMKISSIQNGSSIEPADCVNILGEVVSAPKAITDRRENKGLSVSDILPGDVVIFSHQVIFNFLDTEAHEEPIFRNRIWYMGEEYFKAHVSLIFATIRDGKIRMQNGYVMVEELEKASPIILSANTKKSIRTASAIVSHIRNNLPHLPRVDAERGDRVYFNPALVQIYQINEKPFGIIRQSDIVGKKVLSYIESVEMGLSGM